MKAKSTLFFAVALIASTIPAHARDAARDLRRMIGFSIVRAAAVSEVRASNGEKYLKLDDGTVLKVSLLLLDPLPLTDVVIFAKPPRKEIIDKFGKNLPIEKLYEFKALIDNEAYDVEVV